MFEGKKLGFGLMRLPMVSGEKGPAVDIELCKKMVDYYMEQGFNYFDTALVYCSGQSESAVKEFLTSRYPRDAYTLATKLHGNYFKTKEERDIVFNGQLEKCGVDFFDYYLLHDVGVDHYKYYTELDCFNWLAEKKKQGLVKYMGFSFHDTADLLDKVLTEHPEMDFVQLQINYLDWNSEGIQSRKCYEVAQKHGKPVIVMEPVKGGTLAVVPEAVENLFKEYAPEASVPSWAIRFAASLPNVKMVLSGMSNMEQVIDNTSYMKEPKPVTDEEKEVIFKAVDLINSEIAVPCTGCSYCTEGCPMNIAIPKYFSLYNTDLQELKTKHWNPQGSYYNRLTSTYGKASECIECGQCESICPQHLSVIKYLKDVAARFEK